MEPINWHSVFFLVFALLACGFAVAKYGPQQDVEPNRGLCGNGVHPDGSPVIGNGKLDASDACA